MNNSKLSSYSIRSQKLKNNPTYQVASGCAYRKVRRNYPGSSQLISAENNVMLQQFSWKLSEMYKMGVQFSFPTLGEKGVNSWKRCKHS